MPRTLEGALFLGALLASAAPVAAGGLPSVPGFIVETYAIVDLPMRLSFDEDTLYVGINHPGTTPGQIVRVEPGGSPVAFFGPMLTDPDAVIVHDPTSLVPASDGSVLVGGVVTATTAHITEILADGTGVPLHASSAFLNPSDFVYDSQGRLFFTDYSGNAIYTCAEGAAQHFVDVGPGPNALAIDASDRIYTRTSDGAIHVYESDGTVVDDAFALVPGDFTGLAFGPGWVWEDDLYTVTAGELQRIDENGVVTVIGTGFATNDVEDLVFGPGRALFVSDSPSSRILRITPDVVGVPAAVPTVLGRLSQNVPNPFASRTRIAFTLEQPARTALDLFDTAGRHVRRLEAGPVGVGRHTLDWDGTDGGGRPVPPGVYLYRLMVDGRILESRDALIIR